GHDVPHRLLGKTSRADRHSRPAAASRRERARLRPWPARAALVCDGTHRRPVARPARAGAGCSMSGLFDSFVRALGTAFHPRMLMLTVIPFALAALAWLAIFWF